jgi:hypothetical protein
MSLIQEETLMEYTAYDSRGKLNRFPLSVSGTLNWSSSSKPSLFATLLVRDILQIK